jgi:mRNA-degrading endonuclease toxin of MazEF toxin-antitoxin module
MLWWLLLAALAAVLIAAFVLRSRPGGTRSGRPSTRPPASKSKAGMPKAAKSKVDGTGPQPGEIWWADVPYEDYSGHKVRPCVVLRGDGGYREVLKITSQDQSRRGDHVRIPTRPWDPGADHDSYLDLTGPVKVAVREFDDRAGQLDPAVWRKVRRLYGL